MGALRDVRQSVHRGGSGRSTSMFGGFITWLQDHVVYTGVLGVVEGVLGVLAFGGLLSALLGSAAIKAGAIVAVAVGVLGLFFLLVANRLEWRRRTELDRRLLRRYCDTLEKRHGQQWHVAEWDQEVHISENGDVWTRIGLTAVAACDMLDFCSLLDGPNWVDWPDRHRRKVKVKVRSVEAGGEGGTRSDVTFTWTSRSRIKIMVHLNEPVPRGTEVRFVVDLAWPARCVPLMRGYSAEDFVLRFGGPVDRVRYVVVLPSGFRACYDKIGPLRDADEYSLTSEVNRAGQVETTLVANKPPARRRVGMRLDLKSDNAQA